MIELVYGEKIDPPWGNMQAAHKTFRVALEAAHRPALFLDFESSTESLERLLTSERRKRIMRT